MSERIKRGNEGLTVNVERAELVTRRSALVTVIRSLVTRFWVLGDAKKTVGAAGKSNQFCSSFVRGTGISTKFPPPAAAGFAAAATAYRQDRLSGRSAAFVAFAAFASHRRRTFGIRVVQGREERGQAALHDCLVLRCLIRSNFICLKGKSEYD